MRQLIIKVRGVVRPIIINEGNLPKIPLGGNGWWRNGFEERLGGSRWDGYTIRTEDGKVVYIGHKEHAA